MRLTREPLARASGTIDAAVVASDGRPAATTATSLSVLVAERSDPQYGPNSTSADRTDCVGSAVLPIGSAAGTGGVEELKVLLLMAAEAAAFHSFVSTTTVRASACDVGKGG